MEFYSIMSDKTLSQKKKEEYAKFAEIIQYGRQNPIWWTEYMYGLQMFDYQAYYYLNSWYRRYCLWLCSRRIGKTTGAAIFLHGKMVLFPNYNVYISTNSASQSFEIFKMVEDIALKRCAQFRTCTDIFSRELERSSLNDTGFVHDKISGYNCRLYNNSSLTTLSTNANALRGKGGSVLFDETAWQSEEQMAAVEHFADTDSSFGMGVGKIQLYEPKNLPLQLIYASSAGDITYPFYKRFQNFSKKMIAGDDNYFVCDFDINVALHHSSVHGQRVKSHVTQEAVDKAIEENPYSAEQELFNKFRSGGGENAVVKMETIIRNSDIRKPLLYNDTGKKKFIFTYDPARNFDNSVLAIWQLMFDEDRGYWLQLENVISMVDTSTKKKTPLPMPEQLKIIREAMINYNGKESAEWENIELWIDAGAGGGGISAVADNLLDDWTDEQGNTHRGVIDPVHKQYETARAKYTDAMPIVHLVDPQHFKAVLYEALGRITLLNLIKFTQYDSKDYIMFQDDKGEFVQEDLTVPERVALMRIELMKTEISYMCRYETANGNVTYELSRDKRNTNMHDDMAYCAALAAYALSEKRRTKLLTPSENSTNPYANLVSCVSVIDD